MEAEDPFRTSATVGLWGSRAGGEEMRRRRRGNSLYIKITVRKDVDLCP